MSVNKKFFKFSCEVIISATEFKQAELKAKEHFGNDLYEQSVVWEQLATTRKIDFPLEDRNDIIEVDEN